MSLPHVWIRLLLEMSVNLLLLSLYVLGSRMNNVSVVETVVLVVCLFWTTRLSFMCAVILRLAVIVLLDF